MTKPWYEAAFGADYLERYAHRDDAEAALAIRSLLAATGLDAGARVLDLCCGGGRHVAALARTGMDVIGLDLSRDLLDGARSLEPGAALIRADKRRIPLADASLDAVTHFFTAFGYFDRDEENFAVFAEVARVLRPGGWYLFDFFNAPLVRRELEAHGAEAREESDGEGTTILTRRSISPDGRRVEKRVILLHDGLQTRELTESVRLFDPGQLVAGLERLGFAIREVWGDYGRRPFDPGTSARFIALARKNGEPTRSAGIGELQEFPGLLSSPSQNR